MKIANGIEMLEISAPVMGGIDVVYPTLLWDDHEAVLVDTGYPGLVSQIKDAIEQAGVSFDHLTKIIISHQDLDHIGSLPGLLSEAVAPIEVLANEIEKPYIQGEKMLIKVTPQAIDKAVASLPDHVSPEWRSAFRKTLENPPQAPVDRILKEGQELAISGGIVVIDTPGHTPGHISLYHKNSKTLIAADALIVKDGQLFGPYPPYCVDYDLALASLHKFREFDIETVICYHGGLYRDQVNKRIAEIAIGN
ncbi:MBL fold metallo-hydrolase [Paenibacillus sp. GCM10027628]|uniref:MBL fold metallo-hydrolase n=1 Tax=Paenibacillus sp. GCM10027628 TaxID=3273413 RepID=UPI00364098A8